MWTCTQCGERHEDSFDACWKCGTGRDNAPQPGAAILSANALVDQVDDRTIYCLRCSAEMRPGFLHAPDVRTMSGIVSSASIRWRNARDGDYPDFLPSINDLSLPISAYRCGDCGYLEFYAH